jgi:hypothetical protein
MLTFVGFMTQVPTLQQSEPILIATLVAGGGGALWWAARTLIWLRDAMRDGIKDQAVFIRDHTALSLTVSKIAERQERHMSDTTIFQRGVEKALGSITANVDANTSWRIAHEAVHNATERKFPPREGV